MKVKYLWIDRDGLISWTYNEPTVSELETVESEDLRLLRITDFAIYEYNGIDWMLVEYVDLISNFVV
jgi:hypothetical protein